MIESRNARLLREFNEMCEHERDSRSRWPLVLLIMAVAVIGLAVAVLFSGAARGEQMMMNIVCPKEFNFCYGSREQIQLLIEHNNAATKLLEKTRTRCGNLNDI